MSHHYSGPNFGFPWDDARLDITDIYAFPKLGDATKSVLIMNLHPSWAVVGPKRTTTEPFAPNALYELLIDTNEDAVADIVYRVRISRSAGGGQSATVLRSVGTQIAENINAGEIVVERAPVSTGKEAQITEGDGYRFFAGWRSDPFFFDTLGALNNLQFTGADFFSDKNVCSIVLEIPNSALASNSVGLWARVQAEMDGKWVQAERCARPLQATFLPGEARDAYLAGAPADDARFISVFAHALEHSGGYTAEKAMRVAETLLPDVMHFDPTRPAAFPHNGRKLTDDAADIFMAILTNGKTAGDGVGPHHDLLIEFPYVGPPHV